MGMLIDGIYKARNNNEYDIVSRLFYLSFRIGNFTEIRDRLWEKKKGEKCTRIICYIVDSKIEFASSRLTCMFDRDIRYFFFFSYGDGLKIEREKL